MAMTMTYAQNFSVQRISAAWTSDASGDVTQSIIVDGVILRCETDPGSPAPTDNYDLTLPDEFGTDLLAGQGANRDTANSETFCPGIAFTDGTTTSVIPVAHVGAATLTIANAGNAKAGTIVLFVKK